MRWKLRARSSGGSGGVDGFSAAKRGEKRREVRRDANQRRVEGVGVEE
jgi:hypothetical protein